MIAIINVDPNPRKTGEHLYEIRINKKIITNFKHNREDSLSACLEKAAKAVKKNEEKWNEILELIKEF